MPSRSEPTFFETASAFGEWLGRHGESESELVVGFRKKGSGLPSLTWPESVDEALCHGWIDGVRANVDEHSYRIRFTPRKTTSTWSAKNIARVDELQREGRMQAAGLAAFAHRKEAKSRTYAYEQTDDAQLSADDLAQFRRHKAAWRFFEAQPPRYRHLAIWRIISAKRPETRQSRLAKLIDASQNEIRLL